MPDTNSTQDHLLSNKFYDVLKGIALVLLPAVGTLYFTLAGLWGFPSAEAVVGTIIAVDTFLGVIIKLGDVTYNASEAKYDGKISVAPDPGGEGGMVNVSLKTDPETLAANNNEVTLKVSPPS